MTTSGEPGTSEFGRSPKSVPWPNEFGQQRPLFPYVAILFCLVFGAFFAATTAMAISRGDTGQAVLRGSALLFLISGTAGLVYRLRGRRPLSAGKIVAEPGGDGGIAIPMSSWLNVVGAIGFSAGGVFLLSLAVIRMTARPNDPLRPLTVVLGLLLIAVAVLCFAVGGLLASAVTIPRRLVMSENGIHQNNGALDQSLPWNAITALEPALVDPTGRGDTRTRRRIPMVLLRPAAGAEIAILWNYRWFRQRTFLDAISVQPTSYPIDGGLLYYTIQFYWQHPELRGELTSGAAIERMRQGDVLH